MNYQPLTRKEFAALLPASLEEMLHTDLHMHSKLCDGRDTHEEMVLSAIEKGFRTIGLSDHAATAFDMSYCVELTEYNAYKEEVLRLRAKYADKIRILLGIEQDYYADVPAEGFDYIIGSVHFLKMPRSLCTPQEEAEAKAAGICYDEDYAYLPIDGSAAIQRAGVKYYFHGDHYAFVEEYYRLVSEVPEKTGANFIGHFDLVTKFIEQDPDFDLNHPRYIAAWKKALDKLLPCGLPFEVNFGAISRGYRTTPYPAPDILNYIREHGGKVLLSSDSHRKDTVGYRFETAEEILK